MYAHADWWSGSTLNSEGTFVVFVCVLSFQRWGAPVLKLDYLLRDVVEKQRPLDWEGFWTKQATQVISYFLYVLRSVWYCLRVDKPRQACACTAFIDTSQASFPCFDLLRPLLLSERSGDRVSAKPLTFFYRHRMTCTTWNVANVSGRADCQWRAPPS